MIPAGLVLLIIVSVIPGSEILRELLYSDTGRWKSAIINSLVFGFIGTSLIYLVLRKYLKPNFALNDPNGSLKNVSSHLLAMKNAGPPRNDFYQSLVHSIHEALGVSNILITRIIPNTSRVQTIIFWSEGQWIGNREFDLTGTPYESIQPGDILHYPKDACTLFPNTQDLTHLNDIGWVCAPLINNLSHVIGHLTLIDSKLIDENTIDRSVIEICAACAQKEMERMDNLEKLQLASSVYESSSEGICVTDRNGWIQSVNPSVTTITGYERDEIIGKSLSRFLLDCPDQDYPQDMWPSISRTGRWQVESYSKRKNGEVYPQFININSVMDKDEEILRLIAFITDITNVKRAEEDIIQVANHDPLTGLSNRFNFHNELQRLIDQSQSHTNRMALILLGVDRFSFINDTLGNTKGDSLLQKVALRLKESLNEDQLLARWGGDEFILVLKKCNDRDEVSAKAQQYLDSLSKVFLIEEQEIFLSGSIGISLYPSDGLDEEALLRHADTAMKFAKDEGKNNFKFYSQVHQPMSLDRLRLESDLHHALEKEEFFLRFQTQVNIKSGKIIGAEALVYWDSEDRIIGPGEFIPVAEENGLIVPLGEWVLKTACSQNKAWQEAGFKPIVIAVNLSARQFQHNLVETIDRVLNETGLDPQYLELELTESILMDNVNRVIKTLRELRARSIKISIDDFGTGYSSLSYLKRFPIDKLKIDQSFIHSIPLHRDNSAIASAVIAMGQALDMQVIAEGVETREQLNFLEENQCDEAQGYLFSRPVPIDQFVELLKKEDRL